MMLSIIIPVYNEKKTILPVLKRIEEIKLPLKKEIIIIDDGSKDGTRDILKSIKRKEYKLFFHNKNWGKGAAIRTGLKIAKGDIILIQDADLEYNPQEYLKLLKPLIEEKSKIKIVYGNRFHSQHQPRYWSYYLGNLTINYLASVLYSQKIEDLETCYKVFKKEVIEGMKLKSKGFEIEVEITSKIMKKGYKILEIPINYKSRSLEEGKKITWKDGIKAVYYLFFYWIKD